jgi:NAD(P)H-hydrate repair Nnr-like enzyme with NAD(P)H-hydrate dehydratase domain
MRQIKTLALGAHVLVAKGATTVIAGHGRAVVAPGGNPWLSTAGTGDVLAGAIGAMVASVRHRSWTVFDAAVAGVWLHADAARRAGASFIADDLANALSAARASL